MELEYKQMTGCRIGGFSKNNGLVKTNYNTGSIVMKINNPVKGILFVLGVGLAVVSII